MKRGDIVIADLRPHDPQAKVRPVLIVQNDVDNARMNAANWGRQTGDRQTGDRQTGDSHLPIVTVSSAKSHCLMFTAGWCSSRRKTTTLESNASNWHRRAAQDANKAISARRITSGD
jgi:mRNA-degrading endonuclease toxin of MazEF toxin-antitoxin module